MKQITTTKSRSLKNETIYRFVEQCKNETTCSLVRQYRAVLHILLRAEPRTPINSQESRRGRRRRRAVPRSPSLVVRRGLVPCPFYCRYPFSEVRSSLSLLLHSLSQCDLSPRSLPSPSPSLFPPTSFEEPFLYFEVLNPALFFFV